MSEDAHPKYRPDIDGLRAVAVLSVVGFHAFPGWVKGGFIGVDVFFVISGFLISTILIRSLNLGTFSYRDFYARRIKRIFPSLTLVLLTCLVSGWFFLYRDEHRQVGKHVAGGAAFISNLLLWQESGYFDGAADVKPLLHLWSLGIEEQFYIVWPLLLGLLWKRKWNFALLAGAIAVASFAVNLLTVHTDAVAAFYSPLSRFWELMIGGALAYIMLQRPRISPIASNWMSCSGLALIGVALLSITRNSVFPGWVALLPTMGSFLLILAGPKTAINRYLLSNRPMVWIGLISFPLYLWHWPLLTIARILEGGLPPWEVRFSAVVLSIVLAWMTYVLVEGPLRRSPRPSVVVSLLTFNVVLLICGILVFTNHLAPGRALTATQSRILTPHDAWTDYRKGECFLDASKQTAANFSPQCVDSSGPPGKLVLLWGDSHAAHLYPGLKSLKNALGFQLAQRTATSCPPLIGGLMEVGSYCEEINRATAAFIASEKPQVVVIGSRWGRDATGLEEKVARTIRQLRLDGVAEIVVFGPPPDWTPTLRHFLVRKSGVRDAVAERYPPPQAEFTQNSHMDRRLQQLASSLRFRYISLIRALCNQEGCLVRVGSDLPADLIAMDYDHFTRNASIHLMNSPDVKSVFADILAR